MLAELEELKVDQQNKIAKLTAELKQLSGFIQTELASYNKSIVGMRDELIRMKRENQELKEREQELSARRKEWGQNDSRILLGLKYSADISKTISDITEAQEAEDKQPSTRTNLLLKPEAANNEQLLEIQALKRAMDSMKSHYEKEKRVMADENSKLQRQLNNLIETLQRPDSLTYSNRPQQIPQMSKGSDRNAASSRYGAQGGHDSGFLSLSKHSGDKISASSTGGIKESSKPNVPRLNTEGLQGTPNQQPGEKHPLTSGGRCSYLVEDDKSDSLFVSQKLSEDLAIPFTDEESIEDRFAKQRIVKDILKTNPY